MISFTIEEINASVVSAFIYGILFAAFTCAILEILNLIQSLPRIIGRILKFNRLFEYISLSGISVYTPGGLAIFLFFFSFTLGFILMSYVMLDGLIRLYMIIFSIFGLLIGLKIFKTIFCRVFNVVLSLFTTLSAFILRPPILLFQKAQKAKRQ